MQSTCISLLRPLLFIIFVGFVLDRAASAQTVSVKLLDGKNGKPQSHMRVYILLGELKSQNVLDLKTDQKGEIAFEAKAAKTFQVRAVGTLNCGEAERDRDYPTDEVLKMGLVTTNHCGTSRPEPVRGQLTYIVRLAT